MELVWLAIFTNTGQARLAKGRIVNSVVVSVFAIIILSIIGGLFKVRGARSQSSLCPIIYPVTIHPSARYKHASLFFTAPEIAANITTSYPGKPPQHDRYNQRSQRWQGSRGKRFRRRCRLCCTLLPFFNSFSHLKNACSEIGTDEAPGQIFLVFCGFQAYLHMRASKRGAISLN